MEYLNQFLFNINDIYAGLTVTHLMIINVITLLIVIILVTFILTRKPESDDITKDYQSIIEDKSEEVDLDRITNLLESHQEVNNNHNTFEEEQESNAIISYHDLMKNATTPSEENVVDVPLTKVTLPSTETIEKPIDEQSERRNAIKHLFEEPTKIKKTNEAKHEDFLTSLKNLKGTLK